MESQRTEKYVQPSFRCFWLIIDKKKVSEYITNDNYDSNISCNPGETISQAKQRVIQDSYSDSTIEEKYEHDMLVILNFDLETRSYQVKFMFQHSKLWIGDPYKREYKNIRLFNGKIRHAPIYKMMQNVIYQGIKYQVVEILDRYAFERRIDLVISFNLLDDILLSKSSDELDVKHLYYLYRENEDGTFIFDLVKENDIEEDPEDPKQEITTEDEVDPFSLGSADYFPYQPNLNYFC